MTQTQEAPRLTQFSKGGGCGCKIAPSVLQQILHSTAGSATSFPDLLVGHQTGDDAAVFSINNDTAVISTTDFFVPIVDDPYDFGRIAAANAISDVYAMGGTPLMAVAILGFPIEKLPVETAQQILEGGRSICASAGIPLAGGHTIDTSEPIFGLAVTGTVNTQYLKRNVGARPGDLLFLTKPLGSGLLSTALKRGVLAPAYYDILIQHLTTLNKAGEALGKMKDIHAMTDVTGFGILGHAIEMAEGSEVSLELHYNHLQKIEGTDHCLQQRTVPDATFRNWNSYSANVHFEKGVNVMEAFTLLPDPQTNGGLLFAAAPGAMEEVQEVMATFGLKAHATPVGTVTEKREKLIYVK